jgi:hypothetical protein
VYASNPRRLTGLRRTVEQAQMVANRAQQERFVYASRTGSYHVERDIVVGTIIRVVRPDANFRPA